MASLLMSLLGLLAVTAFFKAGWVVLCCLRLPFIPASAQSLPIWVTNHPSICPISANLGGQDKGVKFSHVSSSTVVLG